MRTNSGKVKPRRVMNPATAIRDGDHLRAKFGDQLCGDGAGVAVPLHHNGCTLQVEADLRRSFAHADHCATRRCLVAPL